MDSGGIEPVAELFLTDEYTILEGSIRITRINPTGLAARSSSMPIQWRKANRMQYSTRHQCSWDGDRGALDTLRAHPCFSNLRAALPLCPRLFLLIGLFSLRALDVRPSDTRLAPLLSADLSPLLNSFNLSPLELTRASQPRYSIPMRRLDRMSKRPQVSNQPRQRRPLRRTTNQMRYLTVQAVLKVEP